MKASLLARAAPALLIAGFLAGGLGAPALAQTGARSGDHDRRADAPMDHRGETERTLVERRIADLHTRLHITPAQSPQWRAFAHVMRENAKDMDRAYRRRAEELSGMNALQDLESYMRLEQARAHDVQRLVHPFRQLYAALSSEQKQEADRLFRAYARRSDHRADTSRR